MKLNVSSTEKNKDIKPRGTRGKANKKQKYNPVFPAVIFFCFFRVIRGLKKPPAVRRLRALVPLWLGISLENVFRPVCS